MQAITRYILGCTVLSVLSGCTVVDILQETDPAPGAVVGSVVGVFGADEARQKLPHCLAMLNPEEYAQRRFVLIRYRRHVRHFHETVAEIGADQTAKKGDRVEVWPVSCEEGFISRTGRVVSKK